MQMTEPEWTSLGVENWGLYQRREGLCYTVDSLILAHFAEPKKEERIYDFCSGTGVVAFLMAALEPGARIIGLELQPQLVELAKASALRNGINQNRLSFQQLDLRQRRSVLAGCADLITANPPFYKVGHGADAQDEERRLARQEHALSLGDLCQAAAYYLKQRGRFLLIHRAARADEVLATLIKAQLNPTRLWPVYSQTGVEATLIVVEACFEGRQLLRFEPPFYIRNEAGESHPALQRFYHPETE